MRLFQSRCAHALLAAAAASGSGPALRAEWILNEEFNGAFSEEWLSGRDFLPAEPTAGGEIRYAGRPADSFQDLAGAGVLRMTTTLQPLTRVGFIREAHLEGPEGTLEARINPPAQGSGNLFELFLFDHLTEQWIRAGLSRSGDEASFAFHSTVDGDGSTPMTWNADQWLRLRIESSAETLRVSVWDDAGALELAGHTFSHRLADWGDEFHAAFGQSLGPAAGPATADVAVDWIRAVPEPATLALLAGGLALLRRR